MLFPILNTAAFTGFGVGVKFAGISAAEAWYVCGDHRSRSSDCVCATVESDGDTNHVQCHRPSYADCVSFGEYIRFENSLPPHGPKSELRNTSASLISFQLQLSALHASLRPEPSARAYENIYTESGSAACTAGTQTPANNADAISDLIFMIIAFKNIFWLFQYKNTETHSK